MQIIFAYLVPTFFAPGSILIHKSAKGLHNRSDLISKN